MIRLKKRPKNIKNPNHPQKGSVITVDPIRDEKHVQAISRLLSDNPRDKLFFLMGVNNGLRAGDLLQLKVNQVSSVKMNQRIRIREQKTGKQNVLMINKTVFKALKIYLENAKLNDDDFLFKSRKGDGPLTVQAANLLIKKWTSAINLDGNYGTHSLRKTFGYIQRTKHGAAFEILCERFKHSNPAVTKRYLGFQEEEVDEILLNEIG